MKVPLRISHCIYIANAFWCVFPVKEKEGKNGSNKPTLYLSVFFCLFWPIGNDLGYLKLKEFVNIQIRAKVMMIYMFCYEENFRNPKSINIRVVML